MLLFLHGFLGQKEDWDPLLSLLPFPTKAIDLPGHGKAPMTADIALSVKKEVPSAPFLIGYSAGGRVALELKSRFPQDYGQLFLLSTHLGYASEEERKKRLETEEKWIEMLSTSPFEIFLEKWYSQPLFHSFKKHPRFSIIFERRKKQNPLFLAQFLLQYSVCKKNSPEVPESAIYLYGEEDLKYASAYRKLADIRQVYAIKNAGHAIHIENPKDTAKIIKETIYEYN